MPDLSESLFITLYLLVSYGLLRGTGRKKKTTQLTFYQSGDWQRLRYAALKHYGRRCALCGQVKTELHVDHVKPRSKYPHLALKLNNLQILCRACNLGKGNWDETDWRRR